MPVDERFYELNSPQKLEAIARLTGARLIGDADRIVSNIGAAVTAGADELCYHEGDEDKAGAVSSLAVACFISKEASGGLPDGVAALIVDHPRFMHKAAADMLLSERHWPDTDTQISPEATIGADVKIAPNACVSEGAVIGNNTIIGPGAAIGPGVVIGQDCQIGACVTIQCALIGDGVVISSGGRIGEAGFGVMAGPDGLEDAPQYGRVILKNKVSIGANSCVDRGAFDDTILHENVKIDNLCQIGHNVIIGRNSVMAAFAGISGSVVIGEGAQFGGRVGIADHVLVGDNVKLGASAGLFRDVPDGETWGGSPAKPFKLWMRELVWVAKQVRGKGRK